MAEDETTFLCGYKGLRRYGTTSSAGAKKPSYSTVIKHRVLPSDTLQGIALKYGASTTEIKRLNKLWSNDSIHLRETLNIPISTTDASPSSAGAGIYSTPHAVTNGRDSCYDSMSETEDHQYHHHHQRIGKKTSAGEVDEGAESSSSTAPTIAPVSKRQSVGDQQKDKAANNYDKSDCSIKDLLSRIDSNIKLTANNVKRLEKQSTVERFLNDNDPVVGTSMSTSASRHSLRDTASTGTPSPTEVRTEVRRPHGKYSLQKLQEAHDQLYQL